jgi:hypothetical protein
MSQTALVSMAAITIIAAMVAAPAGASPQLIAKAGEKGYPARSCQYCHVSAMPRKDTFKPDDLNERGKWLVTEKNKQKATDIDVDWLKSYPGGKEQK